MVSYAHASLGEYRVSCFNARINSVVDGMIPSKLLSSDSCHTDVSYICVPRLDQNHDTALSFLLKLCFKGAATETLKVTHVGDATVYSAQKENPILIICATGFYVKNPYKPSPTHGEFLYKRTHLVPQKMQRAQMLHFASASLPLAEFMQVEIPTSATRSIAIKTQLFITMQLSNYNSLDKAASHITSAFIFERRLISKITKTFDPWKSLRSCRMPLG